MKCPKCQYISFDGGDRCRNCGYDFSLTVETPPAELSMRADGEEAGPLSDFTLREATAAESPAARPAGSAPRPATVELPLFTPGPASDAPLVTPAAVPRPPLSVRRDAPSTPKPKPSPAPRSVRRAHDTPERAADGQTPRLALEAADAAARSERVQIAPSDADAGEGIAGLAAPVGARLGAGFIDLLIVGGIDAAVLYFTLRICELTFHDVLALPLAPLVAFLLFLDGGYFTTFVAAAGQTIGKMATGLRVVPGDPDAPVTERVSLGNAIVRAAAYLVSALPAGLGFLPVLFGDDRRALHDRLADTRVVKA